LGDAPYMPRCAVTGSARFADQTPSFVHFRHIFRSTECGNLTRARDGGSECHKWTKLHPASPLEPGERQEARN
jgi:hypothetical protein